MMFRERSHELERIDTGDYTPEEYATFLNEIRFINRYLGDARALRKSLLRDIELKNLHEFSLLDVACGSGELLRQAAQLARKGNRVARLAGLDLHELSFSRSAEHGVGFPEISYVRGDAFRLPFADGTFDYAISSLFFHHLTEEQIPVVINEMNRVARRGSFVIDLHRHPAAYFFYRRFCDLYRISPLVKEDGLLSILRGFKPSELHKMLRSEYVDVEKVARVAPFRLVAFCRPVSST
jgi:SAM-dependent methyltransferase